MENDLATLLLEKISAPLLLENISVVMFEDITATLLFEYILPTSCLRISISATTCQRMFVQLFARHFCATFCLKMFVQLLAWQFLGIFLLENVCETSYMKILVQLFVWKCLCNFLSENVPATLLPKKIPTTLFLKTFFHPNVAWKYKSNPLTTSILLVSSEGAILNWAETTYILLSYFLQCHQQRKHSFISKATYFVHLCWDFFLHLSSLYYYFVLVLFLSSLKKKLNFLVPFKEHNSYPGFHRIIRKNK